MLSWSHIPPLLPGLQGLPRQLVQPDILAAEGGEGSESRGNLCALAAVVVTALGAVASVGFQFQNARGAVIIPGQCQTHEPCWGNLFVGCPCMFWDWNWVPLAFPRMDELSAALTPILSQRAWGISSSSSFAPPRTAGGASRSQQSQWGSREQGLAGESLPRAFLTLSFSLCRGRLIVPGTLLRGLGPVPAGTEDGHPQL